MKETLFGIFVFIVFAVTACGQSNPTAVPSKSVLPPETMAEAEEALKNFDFAKLNINPNNLTEGNIKDLRANFLEAVKPNLIDTGNYPARLARIAVPIFLFHQADKSQTVVFSHRVPAVFTWKETFVTFSTAAMDLLSDNEIAALVAHEIGHLYYAEALAKARENKDNRAERIVELQCDLVALVTLSKLKIEPSSLIVAVEKLVEKRDQSKVSSFQTGSPSLKSREKVYRSYVSSVSVKKK